jgi:hypothetical protein
MGPDMSAKNTDQTHQPTLLDEVLAKELEYLRKNRHPSQSRDDVGRGLIGLALSGGGIRSATTCLGVLQALSRMDILPMVDYLCTVSGGGYIGGCLSALLSWNEKNAQGKPLRDDSFRFGIKERPAFATSWETFPFRAEQLPGKRRIGEALLAHLRTHGNFLVARWGVFRRETMRSVGVILTGISYNIFFFLLTLAMVSAFYMLTIMSLSPELHSRLAAVDRKRADSLATAKSPDLLRIRDTLVAGDAAIVKECRGAACETRTSTKQGIPTYWNEAAFGASLIGSVVMSAKTGCDVGEPCGIRAVWHPLLVAMSAGALLPILVLGWLWFALRSYLSGTSRLPPSTSGYSEEDAFEQRIVKIMVILTTIVVLTAMLATWTMWHGKLTGYEDLVWLYVPFATFAGARLSAFLLAIVSPQLFTSSWSRRLRSLWGEYQALTMYGWWITLAFALLPIPIYALHAVTPQVAIGGAGALFVTWFLSNRGKESGSKFAIPAGLLKPLLSLAVFFLLALGLVFFSAVLADPVDRWTVWPAVLLLVAFVLFSVLADLNKLSLHYFYRDRLAETYLMSEVKTGDRGLILYHDAMEMSLCNLHGEAECEWRNTAPYHLISASINLAGSRDLTRKDRKSGYWLFSRLFCGSTHTGFRATNVYREGETRLARAIAISGAAASTAMGKDTFFAQAFATALFNVRLGVWLQNPAYKHSEERQEGGVFWPRYLWREVSMATNETTDLVNLSDGAQTGDNVGIYPLFQRKCKVIIAVDSGEDPSLSFDSVTEALRHAYIDLGIDVDIDLTMIRPDGTTGLSRSHCAIGRIRYPDRPNQESYLVYMKNSLTGDEQEPVLNYKTSCPTFPHESTIDQFFNDAQFESYRALGYHLAETTFGSWTRGDGFDTLLAHHQPEPVA